MHPTLLMHEQKSPFLIQPSIKLTNYYCYFLILDKCIVPAVIAAKRDIIIATKLFVRTFDRVI